MIVLWDPELIKELFLKQEAFVKEPYFTENRIRVFGDGVAFSEGGKWKHERKQLSQVFHYEFFQFFIPVMKDILDKELEHVRSNNNQLHALTFGSNIAGKAVIKSFFGVECDDRIDRLDITEWLNGLITSIGNQEMTLRNFLFGAKFLKAGLFGAVSYTHLTLPTICRV